MRRALGPIQITGRPPGLACQTLIEAPPEAKTVFADRRSRLQARARFDIFELEEAGRVALSPGVVAGDPPRQLWIREVIWEENIGTLRLAWNWVHGTLEPEPLPALLVHAPKLSRGVVCEPSRPPLPNFPMSPLRGLAQAGGPGEVKCDLSWLLRDTGAAREELELVLLRRVRLGSVYKSWKEEPLVAYDLEPAITASSTSP